MKLLYSILSNSRVLINSSLNIFIIPRTLDLERQVWSLVWSLDQSISDAGLAWPGSPGFGSGQGFTI